MKYRIAIAVRHNWKKTKKWVKDPVAAKQMLNLVWICSRCGQWTASSKLLRQRDCLLGHLDFRFKPVNPAKITPKLTQDAFFMTRRRMDGGPRNRIAYK